MSKAVLSPMSRDAVRVIGHLVAAERRTQRRSAADLSQRAGISRDTLYRIERGDPGVSIGTVMELMVLLGLPIFASDARGLQQLEVDTRRHVALLPDRVRHRPSEEPDDDF